MADSAGAGEHDMALDEAIALSLALADQQQVVSGAASSPAPAPLPSGPGEAPPGASSEPVNLSDPQLELTDPSPDLHALFHEFDRHFFGNALRGVECRWSPRMTRCAGLCAYNPKERYCSIRISAPLHKLRPRRDLVETLIHEMIHAYLFVAARNSDHSDHGPCFQSHMRRINAQANLNITIYHTFQDEVRHYQQHWWKCDGPCSNRPPFYGVVRRAMNRAPGPSDRWWAEHQRSCGGTYTKIKSPPPKPGARKRTRPGADIRDAFKKATGGQGSEATGGQGSEATGGQGSEATGGQGSEATGGQGSEAKGLHTPFDVPPPLEGATSAPLMPGPAYQSGHAAGCPSCYAAADAAAAAAVGRPRGNWDQLGGTTRSTPWGAAAAAANGAAANAAAAAAAAAAGVGRAKREDGVQPHGSSWAAADVAAIAAAVSPPRRGHGVQPGGFTRSTPGKRAAATATGTVRPPPLGNGVQLGGFTRSTPGRVETLGATAATPAVGSPPLGNGVQLGGSMRSTPGEAAVRRVAAAAAATANSSTGTGAGTSGGRAASTSHCPLQKAVDDGDVIDMT